MCYAHGMARLDARKLDHATLEEIRIRAVQQVQAGGSPRVFISFLKRLMHGQRRPVFLIVDGHPAHRAKLVKSYVESLEGKLRLCFLPPYSPELDPDELVWNDVKNNAVGRSRLDGPNDLHR